MWKCNNKVVGMFSNGLTYLLLTLMTLGFLMHYQTEVQKKAEVAAHVEREVSWLAKALYFEARGEVKDAGLEGMGSVARVILNRVGKKNWPDTVEGVVRQGENRRNRCQFSFICDGKPDTITDQTSFEIALYVASVTYAEFQAGAIHSCAHSYHADYVKREKFSYFMKLVPVKKVGTHIFYCDQANDAVS